MAIGLDRCIVCKNTPTHLLEPCNHTSCYDHYIAADPDSSTCGVCGERVLVLHELEQKTPTVAPVHPNDHIWSPSSSDSVGPSPVDVTAAMQNSNGAAHNGDSGRDANGSQRNSSNGRQPYVIPHHRGGVELPVRPESSFSNASFETQPPFNNFTFGNSGLPRHDTYVPPHRVAPNAQSRFGDDPFIDGPRAPPSRALNNGSMRPPHTNGNMRGPYANGSSHSPYTGLGGGLSRGDNFSSANGLSSGQYGSNDMFSTNGFRGAHGSSSDSSANDSAIAVSSRGDQLARLIRQGRTDNPFDAGYGNPGASRQAPSPNMSTPSQRGQIAAAAGNSSLTTTDQTYTASFVNINGNTVAFQGTANVQLPPWFAELINGFKPTIELLFTSLPFIEACRGPKPSTAGVIKIVNIPYSTSRSEIIAFLGRNAQIVSQPPGSPFHAVHIMMDRLTGKTMDCFVELENPKEARYVVSHFNRRIAGGRHTKIGDRSVVVEISSQADLMSEMFSRAKNVTWEGAMPKVNPRADFYYQHVQSTGFNGFLQDEEIVHLVKHAETPQRSPFAERCLVRVYENLISTLHKYPWFAIEHVLLREREMLFDATLACVRALTMLLRKIDGNGKHDVVGQPTPTVLQELTVAALTCPGFSEAQKASIILNLAQAGYGNMTTGRGLNLRMGGNHKFARGWPFQALVKQPGVTDQMVEYVSGLLREAIGNTQLSIADLHSMTASGVDLGKLPDLRIEYGNATNLADVGRIELRTIESLLSRVLPRGSSTSSRVSSLQS